MKQIKILGTGCKKCNELADKVKAAADAIGLEYEFEKVTDLAQIASYGVMSTPALVVDGVVKIAGKIPSPDELKKLIYVHC